jgi:hypothetical protein
MNGDRLAPEPAAWPRSQAGNALVYSGSCSNRANQRIAESPVMLPVKD